jgi:uracil-DNA glycosylase
MNKRKEMDKIAQEIENCEVCKVGKSGMAVVGEGNLNARVMFVGEAPGKTEALTGRPFVGRSGKLLRSMINSVGLKEEDVYITSPVKYLPDRGTPTSQDIAHGREHLLDQMKVIQPQIVVLLGRVAAEGVLQKKVFVIKEHGQIIDSSDGVKYFLTLHPAAAIRFQKNLPLFKADFEKLIELL